MPTIEQLDAVLVASDDDKLPVSQSGILRRVSRAQLLAGTQSTISLNPGLLGRTSSGFGPPEPITVGGSLTLSNGVLSCPPKYAVAALARGSSVSTMDLVGVSKAGQDTAVSVSSLLSTPGINVSGQFVTTSSATPRNLADWMSDGMHVEAFGAVGDGVTDDTAAFRQALASGQPIRLGPKTYRVDGQWTITTSAILLGVPGVSTLKRIRQSGGAWISILGPMFVGIGVVFDAGGLAVDSWGVMVTSACTSSLFDTCSFINVGGPTLGTGLSIQARDGLNGAPSSHTVRHCCFRGNAVHGLWIQAASGALVENCTADQNLGFGICLDFNDPSHLQVVRHCVVVGCRCWSNDRGISIGNYNETNLEPPRWGPANPDAQDIIVSENLCFDNRSYGIAASGLGIQVTNNRVSTQAGPAATSAFLFNATSSSLRGNSAVGPGEFGVDAGGCIDCEITQNAVSGFDVGINAGGGSRVSVAQNRLSGNGRSITAFQIETDGAGNNFGIICQGLKIAHNTIDLSAAGAIGITIADGINDALIVGNDFTSRDPSSVTTALLANTDRLTISGNSWNGSRSLVAEIVPFNCASYLRVPDISDVVTIPTGGILITGLVGIHQASMAGLITFIRVIQGGQNYTSASVIVAGSGSGASATAYVRDGVVIGVSVISGGSGYTGDTATVTILGDGTGATATAFVGLPVLDTRRIVLACEAPLSLGVGGSIGAFDNWTGMALTIPGHSEVTCVGVGGSWRAVSFTAKDYIDPEPNGTLLVQSAGGDVVIHPKNGGAVRIVSDLEGAGYTTCLGHGSPEGMVTASPGSDYRNLDGGEGQTLWLKRSGTGSSGWFAIG